MNATSTQTETSSPAPRYGGHICGELPSLEELFARREQHARVSAARAAFERTTLELLAARSLGLEMEDLFAQLEVLQAVKAREEAALMEMLGPVR
jgi:hypothetical protein